MSISHVLAIKDSKMIWVRHTPLVMYVWHALHYANSNGVSRRVMADNNSGALIFSTSQYVAIRSSSTWVVVMLSLGKIDHTFWA